MNNSIKSKLKQNKIIYGVWSVLKKIKQSIHEKQLDKQALENFKIEQNLPHQFIDGKIKVGFVFTQELSDWGKVEPIFLALKSDARFSVTVICFPAWLGEDRIIVADKSKNSNYEFIKNKFGNENVEIVDGYINDDDFVDLKSFGFSYVFYNSPYPEFSPKKYHPSIVSKYTKICYTPYGFTLSEMFRPISSSWSFFRWLYCCYCVSANEKDWFDDRLKKKGTEKYQRNVFCGFPRIAQFVKHKKDISPIWSFSKNDFRGIWTPRWSTEDSIGGSNFLKYKDFMLNLVRENKNIDFAFRPHPLTFGNFIKTGQMTKDEVAKYKSACVTGNSTLDETAEYASTFWNSNVLITDFSSIIIEYFVTGNPIIYCTTKTNMDLPTKEFEKILSCCYIANTENEICDYLNQLRTGKDILKEKRIETINDIFGSPDELKYIPERIAEDLWQDCMK